MVTDFIKWCSGNSLPLPSVSEHTKRAGVSQEYPTGYIRNQYPDAYFAPTVATSYLDLKNAKSGTPLKGPGSSGKYKDVKDAGNTPL